MFQNIYSEKIILKILSYSKIQVKIMYFMHSSKCFLNKFQKVILNKDKVIVLKILWVQDAKC